MPHGSRPWVQVELKLSPGAEAWVIVRYYGGSFKLPADAAIGEVLQGVRDHWQSRPPKVRRATQYYRVPVGALEELHEAARANRA
jgi:hypothetical protein